MRTISLQEHLAKGLSIVGRAVATRSTLPITANVLIASDEGRLKLAATNLEIALSCWVGAQIEEEGAITVPARLLTDFVNSLPSEKIEMTLAPRSCPTSTPHEPWWTWPSFCARRASPRSSRGMGAASCGSSSRRGRM